ncbi:MAG: hypothetical protein ACKVUT_06660 [Gaiella sp.]
MQPVVDFDGEPLDALRGSHPVAPGSPRPGEIDDQLVASDASQISVAEAKGSR